MGVQTFVADAAAAAKEAAPSLVVPPPSGAPDPSPHCPKALAPMQKTRPLSALLFDLMYVVYVYVEISSIKTIISLQTTTRETTD